MTAFGKIDYAIFVTPPGYACSRCEAAGCKLWREYNTLADLTELYCCDCAGKDQKKDVSDIDDSGRRLVKEKNNGFDTTYRIDQIGWLVPAVPTEEGDTYWGYTSVPEPGVVWWKKLPTREPLREKLKLRGA